MLDLGYLDPADEITGVQARLNNLGFRSGEVNGVFGPSTEVALKDFHMKHGLSQSGKIDEATKNKLIDVHGS